MNIYNWITAVFSVMKILYFKIEEVFSFQLPRLGDLYFSRKITEVEGSCFGLNAKLKENVIQYFGKVVIVV